MQTRILVVERDPLQLSVLRAELEAEGCDVDTASDGLSAIWEIREGRYDIVILGYALTEIDGLAAARLIGDLMNEAVRPRLIGLTASVNRVLARELVGGKAFDKVIAKGTDLPALVASLVSSLRLARDDAQRGAAEIDLFLNAWDEHETGPERPRTGINGKSTSRILVVEDDELQRTVLSAALVSEGYDVESAADGLNAVRKIRKGSYDLALIDYELPEIDGVAVAKLIAHLMGEGVRPGLIALTASPEAVKRHLRQAEWVFDRIVGKQVGLVALMAVVKNCLTAPPDASSNIQEEANAALS
jgi:two-component system, sensor histidine kinase and response regulator